MTYHGAPLAIACPVSTGLSLSNRAFRCGTGEYIVHIGLIAPTFHRLAFFRQGRLLVDLVSVAVQLIDSCSNDFSLCIVPGSITDPISRMLRSGAEICFPGLAGYSRGLSQLLAKSIGAG